MKRISLDQLPHEAVSHDPQILKQVMLRRGDLPHLTTFARATLRSGQTAHAHQHPDMFEVFFVEAGTGIMRIDGGEHRLDRGVCIVVEPAERHEITNDGASELILIYFGVQA